MKRSNVFPIGLLLAVLVFFVVVSPSVRTITRPRRSPRRFR
mgnify:CR=1 FL=1